MRLKRIHIRNFKSLVDFELTDLKQFCAFVGPNASGKSNIFEALEFSNFAFKYSFDASTFFGGKKSIYSYNPIKVEDYIFKEGGQTFLYEFNDGIKIDFFLSFSLENNNGDVNNNIGSMGSRSHLINSLEQLSALDIRKQDKREEFISKLKKNGILYENDYEQFADNFTKVFIGIGSVRIGYGSPQLYSPSLLTDASNLAQILGSIFEDVNKRNEFIEWLHLLIPEFKNIEVIKNSFDGSYDFLIYEKSSTRPFPRHLISDGTYNILALMAAVYQNSQPQFLCIEEPENGLHPKAIELLVDFFREKCEDEGHYIWLNTHSPTLVRCLEIEEIILVNKVDGKTKAKQLTKKDKIDIKTDEAWLSNALGGGVI
jgi:AAA15 family ATPase/GTPase